jgi:hypothetical protein
MIKVYFLALLALFCFSCSKKHIVPGVYYRGFEKLKLHEDSTFIYEDRVEWIQSASHGRWEMKDNEIILNSSLVYESLPIKVEKSNRERKHVRIYLKPELNMDSLFLRSLEFYLIVNEEDKIKFSDFKVDLPINKEINSFRVVTQIDPFNNSFLNKTRESLSTEVYFVKENQYTDYYVSFPLNGKMLYSETITNDTLIFKGNKVYWPERGEVLFKKSKSK